MAKPLRPDALWGRVRPPLPPPPPPKRPDRPGRERIDDRRCLTGILVVLKTGIAWEDLPAEMGCGCGMACWRRLRDGTEAGVRPRLHERLLAEPEGAGELDRRRAVIDRSHVRARGGERTGPGPVDRRERGSKHHVVTDGGGVPLAATVTAGNVPDVKQLEPAIDARVTITAGGRRWVSQRVGGGSYQSSHDPRLHFGLGAATRIDSLEIRWPSGRVDRLGPLAADRGYLLREGSPDALPLPGFPR